MHTVYDPWTSILNYFFYIPGDARVVVALKAANCSCPPALRFVACCTACLGIVSKYLILRKSCLTAFNQCQDLNSGLFQSGIEASDSGYEITLHLKTKLFNATPSFVRVAIDAYAREGDEVHVPSVYRVVCVNRHLIRGSPWTFIGNRGLREASSDVNTT